MDRIEFDGDEVKYWMGQCARLEQRLADLKADRQPQKIADAVEVALGDDGHCVVYKNAAVKEAIRQALGSTQERGEAVAWGVQKTGEDGVWFVSDSRFTAQHYATAYAHRVSDGKPDQAVIPLYAAPTDAQSRIAALESQLAESREREGRMREFIEEVSKQTPEKPDYWSSCSQCSHNQSDAEDIIDALAAEKEQK